MDVKTNIAKNIVELRKRKKWTQAELAERINYTDKAVSKWERGESTPDVEVLYKMSDLFGVTVDFFFHEYSLENMKKYKQQKSNFVTKMAILGLSIIAVWFISSVIFVYALLQNIDSVRTFWVAFVWAVPVSFIVAIIYLIFIKIYKPLPYLGTLALWTLLASIYLNALVMGSNIWLIFLIGIPIQAAIVTSLFIKR